MAASVIGDLSTVERAGAWTEFWVVVVVGAAAGTTLFVLAYRRARTGRAKTPNTTLVRGFSWVVYAAAALVANFVSDHIVVLVLGFGAGFITFFFAINAMVIFKGLHPTLRKQDASPDSAEG